MPRGRLSHRLLPLVLVGCGTQEPPLDDLLLRDALQADPGVIAAMPAEAQYRLALRFHEAQREQLDVLADAPPAATQRRPQAPDAHVTVGLAVLAFDSARAKRGEDSLVVLSVDDSAKDRRIVPFARVAPRRIDPAPPTLPPLERVDPSAPTYALESRALGGEAGLVIAELVADRGATQLVRVTAWPAGLMAVDDIIFVNGAWLAAMASLEREGPPPAKVRVTSAPPPQAPDAGVGDPQPQPQPSDGSWNCSVAGIDASRERRILWIMGPLVFVLAWGHRKSWKKRSTAG